MQFYFDFVALTVKTGEKEKKKHLRNFARIFFAIDDYQIFREFDKNLRK